MRDLNTAPVGRYRIRSGELASTEAEGNNGAFTIPHPNHSRTWFLVIASDGANPEDKKKAVAWEHVSVHVTYEKRRKKKVELFKRIPTWNEMQFIKRLFFEDEEVAYQLHPKQSNYVNCQPFTLHIWRRPEADDFISPPHILVGPLPDDLPKQKEGSQKEAAESEEENNPAQSEHSSPA